MFLKLIMILYFQIHLLEDTSTLKFSLKHQDGTWCENIIVPELRLLANSSADDHLVISFDQSRKSGADLMVYFRFVFYLGIHFFLYSAVCLLFKIHTEKCLFQLHTQRKITFANEFERNDQCSEAFESKIV